MKRSAKPPKSQPDSAISLTDEAIERKLTMLEKMLATANAKDLPNLNRTFQRLIDEQVRRDLERECTP